MSGQAEIDRVYQDGQEDAERSMAYSLCPYLYGLGTCSMGCTDEPSCMTDGPQEWEPQISDLLARHRDKIADPSLSVGRLESLAQERFASSPEAQRVPIDTEGGAS